MARINYATTLWMVDQLEMAVVSTIQRKFKLKDEARANLLSDPAKKGFLKTIDVTGKEKKKHKLSNQTKARYELTKMGRDYLAGHMDELLSLQEIEDFIYTPRYQAPRNKKTTVKLNAQSRLASQAFEQALLANQDSVDIVRSIKNQLAPIMIQIQQFLDEADGVDDEQET